MGTTSSEGAVAARRWDRRPPWELRPGEMLTALQSSMLRKLVAESPFNDTPAGNDHGVCHPDNITPSCGSAGISSGGRENARSRSGSGPGARLSAF